MFVEVGAMSISLAELRRIMCDPSTPEDQIKQYFRADPETSRPFAPSIIPDPDKVDVWEPQTLAESQVLGDLANSLARMRRQAIFEFNISLGDNRPVLVSEGDSWFQFPVFLEDVIDQLGNRYVVWSTDAAGDTLQNMVEDEPEYMAALRSQAGSVKAFLFSGSGNDVVGHDKQGRSMLSQLLRPFQQGRPASWYVSTDAFVRKLRVVEDSFRKLFSTVEASFPNLPVICHGYDYAIPGGQPGDPRHPIWAQQNEWLGSALADDLGILDSNLQREIVKLMIDGLNQRICSLCGGNVPGGVFRNAWHVDVRGTMKDVGAWADELHPTDESFHLVAEKFQAVLDQALAAPHAAVASEMVGRYDGQDSGVDPAEPPPALPLAMGIAAGSGDWRVAKSLLKLRSQINARFPGRKRNEDGTIGDANHQSHTSDHNPWVVDGDTGVVTAMDITHDPASGCTGDFIAEAIRAARDDRVKYIIWNRRIANSQSIGGAQPWAWRPYTGSNPHNKHVHISVNSDKPHYDNQADWSLPVGNAPQAGAAAAAGTPDGYVVPPASRTVTAGVPFNKATRVGKEFTETFDSWDVTPKGSRDPSLCRGLYKLPDGTLFWESKMAIDADGSPRQSVLDSSSGSSPNTSLRFASGSKSINSEVVPYFVLPLGDFTNQFGIGLGALGVVMLGNKWTGAIFADAGPSQKIGEASIKVHEQLVGPQRTWRDYPANTRVRDASIERGVLYFVFPETHFDIDAFGPNRQAEMANAIQAAATERFSKLGGAVPPFAGPAHVPAAAAPNAQLAAPAIVQGAAAVGAVPLPFESNRLDTSRFMRGGEMPLYHEDMALLEMAPASLLATGLAAARDAGDLHGPLGQPQSSALDAVLGMLRSGEIVSATQVIPSSGDTSPQGAGPLGVAHVLAETASRQGTREPRPLQGATLLKLSSSRALEQLLSVSRDHAEVAVGRVPLRYLAARVPRGGAAPRGARLPAAVPPGGEIAHWHLLKTGTLAATSAANYREPTGVRVAVLDTGVDLEHPQLSGRISNYMFDYPGLNVVSGPSDIVGHGTHVAGIIAATMDPANGVRGMCRPELWALKIFSDRPTPLTQFGRSMYLVDPTMYLRALAECLENDVRVINLSIGGGAPPSQQEADIFAALQENNCVIVAAMGNERRSGSRISYPAAIPGVIAVGATDIGDRVTVFSNRGPHIWLTAPGQAIWSTLPTKPGQTAFELVPGGNGSWKEGRSIPRDTDYGGWDGTSMAAPQVTAAVAMYLATNPNASPTDVRAGLQNSVDQVPLMAGSTFHPDYGYGRLNVDSLLS